MLHKIKWYKTVIFFCLWLPLLLRYCDSSGGVMFESLRLLICLKSVGFVLQCLGVIPYWWSDGLLVMSSHTHSYPAFSLWDWLVANLKYQVSSAEYPYGLRGNCSVWYAGTGDCRSRLRSTFVHLCNLMRALRVELPMRAICVPTRHRWGGIFWSSQGHVTHPLVTLRRRVG